MLQAHSLELEHLYGGRWIKNLILLCLSKQEEDELSTAFIVK